MQNITSLVNTLLAGDRPDLGQNRPRQCLDLRSLEESGVAHGGNGVPHIVFGVEPDFRRIAKIICADGRYRNFFAI